MLVCGPDARGKLAANYTNCANKEEEKALALMNADEHGCLSEERGGLQI
jgi:hypothetical protein